MDQHRQMNSLPPGGQGPPLKGLTLWVPTGWEPPALYASGSPQEQALALQIGAEAVHLFEQRSIEAVRQESHQEIVAAALASATASFESDALRLQSQARRAEEALRAAQFRVEALEHSAATQRQEAMKEARDAFTAVLTAKEEQIRQLQGTLERQMELVTAKVDGLHSSLTKTFSSSKEKGQLGETLVEGLLKRAFDCDVQVVSKEAQTADIRMTRGDGAQYFWEVKNYTRMVNPDEIEKFRRDMRLHPAVRAGVLISLRTGIVGKGRSGDVDMEFLEDGRPILYLNNFLAREDPVFALQGLRPFFDVLERVGSGSAPRQTEEASTAALQSKALLITNLLKSHETIVAKHRNALAGHRKRMETMFTEFHGYIVETEAQLKAMLRVAMGDEDDIEAVKGDVECCLPAAIFTRATLMECGDKRTQDFIKWLLGQTVAEEGEQLELRELFEEARKLGYGEKWIKGQREDLFKETAWCKGSRVLIGLRWLDEEEGGDMQLGEN